MVGVPFLVISALIGIRLFKLRTLDSYKTKLSNFLFFDGTISFLHETYLLIVITGCLNTFYLLWNSFGNFLNSLICMIFITITCFYPLFVAIFYNLPGNYK